MENQPTKPIPDEKDIDLGVLFLLFVRIAKKMLSAFRQMLNAFLSVLIWILLLIRRRFWILLAAIVLGVLPGLYNYLSLGREYYSSMTVRSNFESVHNLYNKIEYFNGLIKSGDNKKLASIFHISEESAGKLIQFEIAPVDDEVQQALLYKKIFYNPEDYARTIREGQTVLVRDSTWSTLLKFKDFKSRLTPYDYPLQHIRAYSRAGAGFSNLQAGLLAEMNANSSLSLHRQAADTTYQEQTKIILNAVANVDTLVHAFSKGISAGSRTENNTLTLSARPVKSPEVEIFDQAMRLKDELGRVSKESADNHDVLQVYADFNNPGVPVSLFKQSFIDYSTWCLGWTFLILLVLEAYKAIDAREKQKRNA